MTHYRSLNHTRWTCQYHVVFIPKYRKKVIYGELRRYLGEVLRRLAQHRESEVEEGHLMVDHVHIMLSIPPKYSVAQVIGYIKGKSAIHIARHFAGRPRAISSGSTSGLGGTSCPRWVETNRRFERISETKNRKNVGKNSSGWIQVATRRVAQVAAQRSRSGRFERFTAKAPGFAGGYHYSDNKDASYDHHQGDDAAKYGEHRAYDRGSGHS